MYLILLMLYRITYIVLNELQQIRERKMRRERAREKGRERERERKVKEIGVHYADTFMSVTQSFDEK